MILAKISKHFVVVVVTESFLKIFKAGSDQMLVFFFFIVNSGVSFLYMFLMLTELSQNKVLQKEKQSAPVCFSVCL